MYTHPVPHSKGLYMSVVFCNPGNGTSSGKPPRLLDRLQQTLCTKHYAYSIEQAYVHWVRRYILFHNKRHPQDMGGEVIERFLTHLAGGASTEDMLANVEPAFGVKHRRQDWETCDPAFGDTHRQHLARGNLLRR